MSKFCVSIYLWRITVNEKQTKKWAFLPLIFVLSTMMSPQLSFAGNDDVKQLKKELKALKKQYQQKIVELEQRLNDIEDANDEAADKTDELAVEISQQSNQEAANTFNPGVGVVLNGKMTTFSPSDYGFSLPGFFEPDEIGPASNGLELGETELNLTSNIDDKFYGSLTLSFGGGEANVEEAFLQTISIPHGVSIKFGRFFSNIGYLTRRHTHTDSFTERPLPYEAFLGGQFGDDGVQFNWVAPTDLLWESGVELYRGDSFPGAGAANNGTGTWTAYSHIGGDINDSQSWRAGISYLNASVNDRESALGESFTGKSKLFIADFVWKWAPNGNPFIHNAQIQGEYLSRSEKGNFTDVSAMTNPYDANQDGWYLQGVYQFMPQWRVGVRYSKLNADTLPTSFNNTTLDNLGHNPNRTSLMFDWSNSEFSRLRLQYSQDKSNLTKADVWTLQYIAAFGAHGAHTF